MLRLPRARCKSSISTLRLVIDQRLVRNVVQITDAILVHHGHLEIGQVHNQSLLDLQHALLEHIVRLVLCEFCEI